MRTIAGALGLLLGAALAAAQPEALTATQIMARVTAANVANGHARNGLTCQKTEAVFDTGKHPEKLKRVTVWQVWYLDDEIWQMTLFETGRFIDPPVPERVEPDFTTKLAELFYYELADPPRQPDPISGKDCWAVRFKPDPEADPDGIKETIASKNWGIMFIDPDGFWIRYTEGSLKEGQRVLLVGKVDELGFRLEQTDEFGPVMPRVFEGYGSGSKFFGLFKTKERRKFVITDCRPVVPETATPPR